MATHLVDLLITQLIKHQCQAVPFPTPVEAYTSSESCEKAIPSAKQSGRRSSRRNLIQTEPHPVHQVARRRSCGTNAKPAPHESSASSLSRGSLKRGRTIAPPPRRLEVEQGPPRPGQGTPRTRTGRSPFLSSRDFPPRCSSRSQPASTPRKVRSGIPRPCHFEHREGSVSKVRVRMPP